MEDDGYLYNYAVYKIPEHSNEPFGKTLRKLLITKNIKPNVLAIRIHKSTTTINNYLKGEFRNPDDNLMIDVAAFFDVQPSFFREFRINKLFNKLIDRPTLIDVFLDIANAPDSSKMLRDYKEYKKQREAYKSIMV